MFGLSALYMIIGLWMAVMGWIWCKKEKKMRSRNVPRGKYEKNSLILKQSVNLCGKSISLPLCWRITINFSRLNFQSGSIFPFTVSLRGIYLCITYGVSSIDLVPSIESDLQSIPNCDASHKPSLSSIEHENTYSW